MSADQLVGLMLVRRAGGVMSQTDFVASPVGGQTVLDALVAAAFLTLIAGTSPRVALSAAAEAFI